MIISKGKTLEVRLPETVAVDTSMEQKLKDMEFRHIRSVLQRTAWRITGKGGAAEVLGLKGTTLQSKMKKLGIKRPSN
jgi:transcriptional regulator with GAF, ATPase, and Fis domain